MAARTKGYNERHRRESRVSGMDIAKDLAFGGR
jgi:hypothetical protein